jgi:hypothetical protein
VSAIFLGSEDFHIIEASFNLDDEDEDEEE